MRKKGVLHTKLKNGAGYWKTKRAWNVFIRMEHYYNIDNFIDAPKQSAWGKQSKAIHPCYYKEARAMLAGLHWQGKNKCVKLLGDA